MATTIAKMTVLAVSAFGATAVVAIPVAREVPDCGTPEQGVLRGDYGNTQGQQNQLPAAPSASWDRGLGTLTAHFTDHSGVASQCTYTSHLVNRNFSLPPSQPLTW
jgi:hypothetical protein